MLKAKFKILLSVLVVMLVISPLCFATDLTVDDATILSEDAQTTSVEDATANWIKSDLYKCEQDITISEVVDGNAFIMGKNVTISGEIGGDLFVMADKVTVDGGYIYSSIFVIANEVTINGVVYDVYGMCNTFNLKENGFIYRDLKLTTKNANFEGRVKRDAYLSCNNITIAEDSQIFLGNLNYSSKSEINIPEGAVAGEVKFNEIKVEKESAKVSVGSIIGQYILDLVKTVLYTFVVAVVLLWLTPKFVERVVTSDVKRSFISLGIGVAAPIALVLGGILLMITVIAVPVAFTAIGTFVLIGCIARSITSIFFGNLLAKSLKVEGNVKTVSLYLAVSAALWIVSKIPVLGGFVSFLAVIFGIGLTLVNMVYRKEAKKETKKEVVAEAKTVEAKEVKPVKKAPAKKAETKTTTKKPAAKKTTKTTKK